MNKSVVRPMAELTLVVVTLALALANWHNPARPFLALLFFFTIPGLPIARMCRFGSIGIQIAVGVALSTVVATFGAQVMLWFHAWHPKSYVTVLAALAVPALVIEIARTLHTPAVAS